MYVEENVARNDGERNVQSMMDFLLMAFLYTVSFVTISYIVIAGKYEYHRNGWIGLMRRNLLSVSFCFGESLIAAFVLSLNTASIFKLDFIGYVFGWIGI